MAADTFALEADEQGRLVLRRPGEEDAVGVQVRRAFPWSDPMRHISVRDADGQEILRIEDLAEVEGPTRRVIEGELARWSFIPRIQRVVSVEVRFGFQQWRVETDRGEIAFRVQEREDIRFLGDGRFSIKDVDGCVYELPPLDQLDEKSRRAVEVLV